MANEAAYVLKDSYDPEDFAGSVAVGDKTLDVKERLEEGGGTILTDDPQEIRSLDSYPALKRTAVSAAKEGAESTPDEEEPRSGRRRRKPDAEPGPESAPAPDNADEGGPE